jgi:hypothetical protein
MLRDRGGQAAFLTRRRCLTVYCLGKVPSASIRIGQRSQRGLSLQHFFFGFRLDTG